MEEPISSPEASKLIFDGVVFGINKHLQNRAEIRDLLADYGVQGISSFGSDNPPKVDVVAISEYLPKAVAHEVIQVAKQVGIKYFNYFDNAAENAEEDVLFGGYGEAKYEIA